MREVQPAQGERKKAKGETTKAQRKMQTVAEDTQTAKRERPKAQKETQATPGERQKAERETAKASGETQATGREIESAKRDTQTPERETQKSPGVKQIGHRDAKFLLINKKSTMKSDTKSLYKSSMVVFYMVCRFGWNLYTKYWEDFAAFSSAYTKDTGNNALKAISAAQALPDAAQRRGNTKQQGTELDDSSRQALLFWKTLRRYIIKSFAVPYQAAAIGQAGGTHFAEARNGNLAEITDLLSAGQTYIAANAELLMAQGTMPGTFEADYNKGKETYDTEHLDYGQAKGEATDGTVDKITANNALHTSVQEMFADAQIVFEDQKAIAKQFSFEAVKRLVTKDLSGIHFLVINPATGKPLTTAFIATDEGAEIYPVNARGVLDLRMKTGVHSVTVTAPDFAPYSGVVKVDAGIMHRVKITLAKLNMEATVSEEVNN